MSIGSSLKSFFSKVGQEIEKLFGGKASVEQKVQAVITYIAPLVNTIVTLADPAIAPLVSGVISTVQADLATVSTIVQAGTAVPGSTGSQSIITALTSVKNNFATLLADAGVKNSANFSKISAAANLIIGETEAVVSELASSTVATGLGPQAPPTPIATTGTPISS